jgi:formylglycine-generating enzyme required for sulfatase activity
VTVASVASAAPVASVETSDAGPAQATPPAHEGMLFVPGGKTIIGSDFGGEPDEHPQHEAMIASFWLDATEVTNEAYSRCVEVKVCSPPDPANADKNRVGPDARFRGPKQPVSAVSWFDAKGYCAWRGGARLPTEAELERAGRGDDGRHFPWGNEQPTAEHAVFGGIGGTVTQNVGTHPKGDGPYGHHDLEGNVWEWTEDPYDPFAYRRETAKTGAPSTCELALEALAELRAKGRQGYTGTNPIPTECERVLRGGAFNYPPEGLRSSNRVHHPPRFKLVMAGFRCAMSG